MPPANDENAAPEGYVVHDQTAGPGGVGSGPDDIGDERGERRLQGIMDDQPLQDNTNLPLT